MKIQCNWEWNEGCYFTTESGSAWHYFDGCSDPSEHGQYYCHHCGNELVVDEKSLELLDE